MLPYLALPRVTRVIFYRNYSKTQTQALGIYFLKYRWALYGHVLCVDMFYTWMCSVWTFYRCSWLIDLCSTMIMHAQMFENRFLMPHMGLTSMGVVHSSRGNREDMLMCLVSRKKKKNKNWKVRKRKKLKSFRWVCIQWHLSIWVGLYN